MRTTIFSIFLVSLLGVEEARGQPVCRECRDRYQSARERCERTRLSARECQGRALEILERCLDACGFIQSNVEEPPTRNPVADPEVVASIEGLSVNDGRVRFALALDTSATGPFRKLVVGFASLAPDVCAIEAVRIGSGLLNYVAENDEPPACDIVIFPPAPGQPAASVTKLFLDEPYDSRRYGSEYLVVELSVTADEPAPTVIQLFGEDDLTFGSDGEPIIAPNDCDAVRLRALPAVRFVRGDSNTDASVDVSDAVTTLDHLFGSRRLECEDAADFDDNGAVDIADPILLLSTLFAGAPSESPVCARDDVADALSCDAPPCDG